MNNKSSYEVRITNACLGCKHFYNSISACGRPKKNDDSINQIAHPEKTTCSHYVFDAKKAPSV